MARIHDLLAKPGHEGLKLKPYVDTKGKLTIGVGRNLTDRGLSQEEVWSLLENDVKQSEREAKAAFPWWLSLDTVRQDVIVMLVFNMGLPRFSTFRRLAAALQARDWDRAATELLDSKWAREDVGRERSSCLADMIRKGHYPGELPPRQPPSKKKA